ncbi:MAG: hypothetical protein ACO396_09455, partial [Phycisphaerales bacterium]
MSKASAVGSTTRTIDRSDRLGRWARGTLIATGVLLVATLARVGQLKAAPSEALSAHLDPRTTT